MILFSRFKFWSSFSVSLKPAGFGPWTICIGLWIALGAHQSWALPEAARYGHFSCTTCHVSPSGGGLLTPYGHDFNAEKLSTWSKEAEADPLHGLISIPETFLVGGDFRWVGRQNQFDHQSTKHFWRMQSDLQLGMRHKRFWAILTPGTAPAGPTTPPNGRIHLRGYEVRQDLLDQHLLLRAGLYIPKYGLMLSDHTAFVRGISGVGADSEQTQLEMILQNDVVEGQLSLLFPIEALEREGKAKSGWLAGLSVFLGRHRANFSLFDHQRSTGTGKIFMTSYGLSGVASLTRKLFLMLEADATKIVTESSGSVTASTQNASFLHLGYEAYRGVIPYLRLETMDPDTTATNVKQSRYGFGLNFYPRPHLQWEGRWLQTKSEALTQSTQSWQMLLHYYL